MASDCAYLKVDTGMGRLGVWYTHARELLDQVRSLPGISLGGVFTHFACADHDPDYTLLQQQRSVAGARPTAGACGSTPTTPPAWIPSTPAVRSYRAVGLLQFGVPPYPDSVLASAAVEPIFSFRTRLGLIKQLPTGTDISYSRTFQLQYTDWCADRRLW